MKREVKIVHIAENAYVGFGIYEGFGVGSVILDAKEVGGNGKKNIEKVMLSRFNSQIGNKKRDDGIVSGSGVRYNYDIQWYDFSEIVKKKDRMNIMEKVCECVPQPKVEKVIEKPVEKPNYLKQIADEIKEEIKGEVLKNLFGGING